MLIYFHYTSDVSVLMCHVVWLNIRMTAIAIVFLTRGHGVDMASCLAM